MQERTQQIQARVFLVDDHALVREHLTALIQSEPGLTVCGEAEDVPAALKGIRQQEPELVILDLSLKRSNGLDLLKDIKGLQPRPMVLVLSMHEEAFYAERALRAGAQGYITKKDATANILPAIRQVLGGQGYLSPQMASQITNKSGGAALAVNAAVGV